ncbi:hypothetical protein GLIP_3101 [Aliiglaciecola lipolytica E3]|uniref:Uncharacterized protein n=1 Tax=Aliiglaciecola lipolytica E3 TaxID=1127673 RepID=K6YBZ2_9ALTE|nr:hypothetical protein GLIP_3101 [Aliiglaciecola lipolytica E3]
MEGYIKNIELQFLVINYIGLQEKYERKKHCDKIQSNSSLTIKRTSNHKDGTKSA